MAVAAQSIPRDDAPGHAGRNFWLSVWNGALATGGHAFFNTDTVLAGLAFALTGSPVAVGALHTIERMGWMWPQMVIGSRIEQLPLKMRVYQLSALVRVTALACMVAAVLTLHEYPLALYAALVLLAGSFSSGGSLCLIPFMDIVAKGVPEKRRPMMFAYRAVFGGMLGFASGILATWMLSDRSGVPYPYNYALLLAAGIGLCGTAYLLFMQSVETPCEALPQRGSMGQFFKRGSSATTRIASASRSVRRPASCSSRLR